MKYEFLEKAILAVLVIYLVIGATWKFLPAHHLYPFFSWDLYSTIPNTFSVYDIKFSQVGGRAYSPPVSYKHIFSKSMSDDLFTLAEDLSISVKSGNLGRIKASQEDLSKMVGPGKKVYELVESIYDPMSYKSGKKPIVTNSLGSFTLP